jgi:unsaturated rhamnogalacturonyl hydrolase
MKAYWRIKVSLLFVLPALFIGLAVLSCCSRTDEWGRYSPQEAGRLVIEELLSRPEFMMLFYQEQGANLESGSEQKPGSSRNREFGVYGIHYAEACAGFGAVRLACALKDWALLERLAQRYAVERTDTIPNSANHVDVNVFGILPLALYRAGMEGVHGVGTGVATGRQVMEGVHQDPEMEGGNRAGMWEAFREQGMRYADGQWEDPLPDGLTRQVRYWIDDIWMIASLQIQAYRVTGNPEYLNRAAKVVTAYLEKLQQPNGLFYHGTEGPFFWGRGNGWVASGLAELLTELPENDPHYPAILAGYHAMMEALLQHQGDDGLWGQLIDHPESFRETSGSAMFGYAMQMGVQRGLLPRRPYGKAVERAWQGLGKYLNEDGTLREVCVGTGQSTDINHYLTRPRVAGDLHGQAPLLWFAYSLIAP